MPALGVPPPMRHVPGAKSGWKENLDALTDEICPVVAKELRNLLTGKYDTAGAVYDNHRVGRGIEDISDEFRR